MFETSKHPSDEEILQFIDDELSVTRTKRLREHLRTCSECQERRVSIESRFKILSEFYGSESIEPNSMTAASRLRLQEKLGEPKLDRLRRPKPMTVGHPALSVAAVTLLIVIGFALYGGKYMGKSRSTELNLSGRYFVPNHSLTPGAVRSVSLNDICSATDDDLDPSVSSSTEMAVLREYGLSSDPSAAHKYQIDYLVNPQLGGTGDIRNLWPQPYSNSAWNAHAKDVLEKHLHQMVCNRTVDLAEAQRELAADWIAAYRKYVGREGS